MLKWWMRLSWFISSYTPLWIVLCITNYPIQILENGTISKQGSIVVSGIFLAMAIISNLIIVIFLSRKRNQTGETIETKNPIAISDLSKEYIVTYAISLIGFNLYDWRQAISFAFLIAFFAFLYVKYNDITYNPMLDCFGFRLFKTTIVYVKKPKNKDGKYIEKSGITLITKKKKQFLDESAIQISNIGGDIFIEVSNRQIEPPQ